MGSKSVFFFSLIVMLFQSLLTSVFCCLCLYQPHNFFFIHVKKGFSKKQFSNLSFWNYSKKSKMLLNYEGCTQDGHRYLLLLETQKWTHTAGRGQSIAVLYSMRDNKTVLWTYIIDALHTVAYYCVQRFNDVCPRFCLIVCHDGIKYSYWSASPCSVRPLLCFQLSWWRAGEAPVKESLFGSCIVTFLNLKCVILGDV